MRSPRHRALVLGNWKMNMTVTAAEAAARSIAALIEERTDREVAVAPPFTALATVAAAMRGTPLRLAAQDLFWEDEGPYTGEISGAMLAAKPK